MGLEVLGGKQRQLALRGGGHDRAGQRVLAGLLQRGEGLQQVLLADPGRGFKRDEARPAFG